MEREKMHELDKLIVRLSSQITALLARIEDTNKAYEDLKAEYVALKNKYEPDTPKE
jgi:predicted  nucleic acid-binding Zn-ribbon protein